VARAEPPAPRTPDAVARARRSLSLLGHPEDRWSIVLHARLAAPLGDAGVIARVAEALAARPGLGLPPAVASFASDELAGVLDALAGETFAAGGSALRIALVDGPEPGVIVAAHHGALDGLGLIALLAIVIGSPVTTSARGVSAAAAGERGFAAFALRRGAEAVFAPPTRIAGTAPGGAPGSGSSERLAELAVPALEGGVRALTAAAARAVIAFNRDHGRPAPRVTIAIGASERSGSDPTLEHRGAWMRLAAGDGSDGSLERALRDARPLPVGPSRPRFAGVGRLAAAVLSRRLGSTLLVSNLGAVAGPQALRSIAFYPVTHGHRAVALGAATVGERTVLTLRGEARDFDRATLESLLAEIAAELAPNR
jgi:hypothetical protein